MIASQVVRFAKAARHNVTKCPDPLRTTRAVRYVCVCVSKRHALLKCLLEVLAVFFSVG
jgi:hypothetical protein